MVDAVLSPAGGAPPSMIVETGDDGGAVFSPDRRYRYDLWRTLDDDLPHRIVTFVMLNPSTADAFALDPTVRRCRDFARRERASMLRVVNLFALRSPKPEVLYGADDPVGPENDMILCHAAATSQVLIAAWGVHGAYRGRGAAVVDLVAREGALSRLWCLRLTKDGYPGHPLYVPKATPLAPYRRL